MRDFPFFSTENGVASLFLKEVPYSGRAYIRLQDASDPDALIKECLDFCRAVEAKEVFATGHESVTKYPLFTKIIEMCCARESLPDTDAALFPVQKQTLSEWRELYNDKMLGIDGASYMTIRDAEKLLINGGGYFVHRNDVLLGIGIASGERIEAIAANATGFGKDTLLALVHALSSDRVSLEVASTNERAMNFYIKMGFLPVRDVATWYKIF